MTAHDLFEQQVAVRGHVRRNVVPAVIVAVLMCAYGFGRLVRPEADDLFGWCNLILFYTMRIGGIGFGLVAVWSLIGHLPALAVDAVLSVACGLIFMATALGMWADGGDMLNSALFVIFGWLFISVGLWNWRMYQHWAQSPGQASFGGYNDEAWEDAPRSSGDGLRSDSPRHVGHTFDHEATKPSYSDGSLDRPDVSSSLPDEYAADLQDDISETSDDESGRDDGGFLAGFGRTGAPPGV